MAGRWRGQAQQQVAPEPGPVRESVPASEPRIIVLDAAFPVPGHNVVGRVEVGAFKPHHPTSSVQDRTWWVKSIELLPSGVVVATDHDDSRVWFKDWLRLE